MIQDDKVYKLIQVQRFKQKQISNVMKNKNHNRNKNIKSGPKSNSQQKSKQKSKDKTKKFNPLQYLNALIQLTSNTNVLKPKTKKSTQKRDLSSALTTATPAMSQTISSSKIRCKSSYSQYRKKHTTTNNLKQILNVNLNHYIITEQEDSTNCIKFTSISSATNSNQQTPVGQNGLLVFKKNQFFPQSLQLRNNSRIIDYNYYASKIQRAWRSYQTYQMVRRYYKHFKKETKCNHQRQQHQKQPHHVPPTYRDYKHSRPKQHLTSFQTHLNDSQRKVEEEYLQKTIKFKIKSKQISQNQKQQKVQRQISQSSNEFNLTQKLNQLKQFVENQKLIEKKDKIQIKQLQNQKCRKSDDSSTQKKNNINKKQNSDRQSQGLISNKSQQECSSISQNATTSLVDSMIKKQTQKYNEILKLIEGCNKTEKQNNTDTGSILSELLNRLEKHKEELITSKQVLVKKVAPRPENPKTLISSESKKSSKSFLAFNSKDVYRQFDDYDINTEKKDVTDKQILVSYNKSKQKVNKQEEKLKQESQKKIESLRKYYNLLSNESEKLQYLIQQSSETDNFCLQNINNSSNQSSKLNTESINLSQQDINQSLSKKLLRQGVQIKQQQSWLYSDQDLESVCSQTFSEDSAHKMFKEHMNLVKLRRRKSIENLQKLVADKGLSKDLYEQKMKQIEQRFVCQSESILEKKEKYLKSLRSVKKEALQFQKELIIDSKNSTKKKQQQDSPIKSILSHGKLGIRKSFSAESIVLKCILKQPILKSRDFKLDEYLIEKNEITKLEENKNDVKQQSGIGHNQRFGSQIIKLAKCSFFDEQREQVISILSGNYNSGEQQFQHIESQEKQHQQQAQQSIFDIVKKAISQESQNDDINDIECRQQQSEAMGWSFESIKDEQIFKSSLEKQQQVIIISKVEPSGCSRMLPVERQISADDFHNTSTDQNNLSTDQNPTSPLAITSNSPIPSSDMMKRCSQQLQKLIQSQLINEFLQEIYLNDHLIMVFKPYIEQIYQFPPITDSIIQQFAQQELKKHLPQKDQLIRKANQKINPTSIEILRLVRDFNFEIDQYQLILSQDIFRKARKHIELEYSSKITSRQNQPIKSLPTQNEKLSLKVHERQTLKCAKISKYMQYERDMKIMYMKAVFNCLNEFLIQQKSIATHVNTRTNIGAGELCMSIKQFNTQFNQQKVQQLFTKSYSRMDRLIRNKCMLPAFKNYKQVSEFQHQMMMMIRKEFEQTEYKWVTYMDEVLEIWDQVANWVVRGLIKQAVQQIGKLTSHNS